MEAILTGPTSIPLQWRDEFACGETLIDEQHQALFSQVNRMTAALAADDTPKAIEYLDELVMHTIEHFRYEEDVLRQCDYAELREHQLDHMVLLERTLTYRHDVARGVTPLEELIRFLVEEVIVKHLIETDQRYFDRLACLLGPTPGR